MDWEKLLEQYKIQIGIGLVGVVLLGLGIWLILLNKNDSPKIEILPAETASQRTIWVDLEGAVENPGIYELPDSSRLNDLLIKAGGLSAEADREWVAKNLNLADKLADGEKIYLPTNSEISHFGGLGLTTSGQVAGTSAKVAGSININTASMAQLDSLYGIGAARAQDIISGRPYQKIEDLVSRKIISQSIYDRIKDRITVY